MAQQAAAGIAGDGDAAELAAVDVGDAVVVSQRSLTKVWHRAGGGLFLVLAVNAFENNSVSRRKDWRVVVEAGEGVVGDYASAEVAQVEPLPGEVIHLEIRSVRSANMRLTC